MGKTFVRQTKHGELRGKIVETEAYLAQDDEAAHGFRGKNSRNRSLYKSAGHLYVHQNRHHFLADLVTEKSGVPSSVLIRAVEPTLGIEEMQKRRGDKTPNAIANGPGKFCQAFNITKEFDGLDITEPTGKIFILEAPRVSDKNVATSARVGISKSQDLKLRFYLKDNSFVSHRKVIIKS